MTGIFVVTALATFASMWLLLQYLLKRATAQSPIDAGKKSNS